MQPPSRSRGPEDAESVPRQTEPPLGPADALVGQTETPPAAVGAPPGHAQLPSTRDAGEPFCSHGGLLPGHIIESLAEPPREPGALSKPLISPFLKNRLKSASYDLTVGDQYYIYRGEQLYKWRGDGGKRGSPRITELGRGGSLSIPPNAVCYVLTEENVCIPKDVAGLISLRVSLLSRGIVMPMQGQIDPGYEGKLVGMLYNLSSQPVTLQRGDHVLTIQFIRLEEPAKELYSEQPDASYKGLSRLDDFVKAPVNSSLRAIASDLEGWRKKFYTSIPIVIAALAVMAAVASVVIPVATLYRGNMVPQVKTDTVIQYDTVRDTVRLRYPDTVRIAPR